MAGVETSKDQTIEQPARLYYRPREVQEVTGLSRSVVFEAIWAGRLRAHRMGKAWLVPVDAVREWIEGSDSTAA